jgi:hypothetical protein
MSQRIGVGLAAACTVAALVVSSVHAEDVEKKLRLSFSIGGYDGRKEIRSASANILSLTDENDVRQNFFEDPRNDDAAQNSLSIQSATRAMLSVQYAVTKMFVVEVSGGYQKGDVGNVELQGQFFGEQITEQERFKFRIFTFSAGQLTQVPLQATALARFRPRAGLNPFIGFGIGYIFMGFDPSAQLNQVSRNLDRSFGQFARVGTFQGGGAFTTSGQTIDLEAAQVEVPDTFEWHLKGGLEYSFRPKWVAYFDLTYTFASRSMTLLFNPPGPDLGISVPAGRILETDPLANQPFGPILISEGGLVDIGRLVPLDAFPNAHCEIEPTQCKLVAQPDGQPDPGYYYIQGGQLKYDGVSLLVGVRYTF